MSLAKLKNPTKFWLGKTRTDETKEKIRQKKIGKSSWNKNTKGIMKPNKTSFKKGEHHGIEFGKDKRCDGKNHYNWQGGKSFEQYGQEFNKDLKIEIRNKYNYICQECYKQGNIVHHIDYDKKNNQKSNLIILCRSCHMKTNFDRNDWKQYFQNKIIAAAETKRSNTKSDR